MMDKRKEMILGILDKLGIHFVITKGFHRTLFEYQDFEETLILGGRCLSEYLKQKRFSPTSHQCLPLLLKHFDLGMEREVSQELQDVHQRYSVRRSSPWHS
jgi:hypothetical protein